MSITPLHVLEFDCTHDEFAVIVIAEPDDPGAFAYPNASDPCGVWARRVRLEVVL